MNKTLRSSYIVLAAVTLSCGEETPSFVETNGESYAVAVETGGDDPQPSLPEKSTSELEDVFNELDEGLADTDTLTAGADVDGMTCENAPTAQTASSADQSTEAIPSSSKPKTNGKHKLADHCSGAGGGSQPQTAPDAGSEKLTPSSRELTACAKLLGASSSQIVSLSGEAAKTTIKSTNVLALRVTGNQRHVNIDLSGAAGSVAGICVFAAGNQPKVSVKAGLTVGRIVYVARGNQAAATITVTGSGSLNSGIFDLKGNSPSLAVDTGPTEHCRLFSVSGIQSAYTCQ